MKTITLTSPLFTDWTEPYTRLYLTDTNVGAPLVLTIDGQLADFQYTGLQTAAGTEVMVKLGFTKGQTRTS